VNAGPRADVVRVASDVVMVTPADTLLPAYLLLRAVAEHREAAEPFTWVVTRLGRRGVDRFRKLRDATSASLLF
jgi:hypothetical protein